MAHLGYLAEFEAACPNLAVRARVLFSSAEDTWFLCPKEMLVNVKFYWESWRKYAVEKMFSCYPIIVH